MSGRGFTIVEMLIAVLVSAIGFAAIFSLQVSTMQGNIASREMTAAVNVAERYIEQLRRDAFLWTEANPPPGPLAPANPGQFVRTTALPVDHNTLDGNRSNLLRQRYCIYTWMRRMAAPYDGLIEVRVNVQWPRQDAAVPTPQACPVVQAGAPPRDISERFELTIPAILRRHPGAA